MVNEGADVSIFCNRALDLQEEAILAGEKLAERKGIDVEIINILTIKPLDRADLKILLNRLCGKLREHNID
jgi:transketolase C-terminal domain/subunit